MSCRDNLAINEEEIINEVRSFPELWDTKLQIYKNTRNKDAAWIRISERMKYPIEELKAKWKQLRDKYVREKKSITASQLSGSGISTRDKWELFELMEFLKDTIKPRKTTSSMTNPKKNSVQICENGKSTEVEPELVIETNVGDFVINQIRESEDEEELESVSRKTSVSDNLSRPSTSSSTSVFANENINEEKPASKNSNNNLNDTAVHSRKKPRISKSDPYEQTLLKIWKENTKILSNDCENKVKSSEELFLLSLEDDLKSLEPKYQRKAKQGILKLLDDLITEQEEEKRARDLND